MSPRKLLIAGLSCSLLLIGETISSPHADAGATYNPATTFETGWSTQSNPNGVWSYGYSTGFTNSITLYNQTVQNGVNGPNAQYWISSSINCCGGSPAAEYNDGPAYYDGNVDFAANQFLLVAGSSGPYLYSDLVFTAPVAGTYSITGNFLGDQYGIATAVGIIKNGTVLFDSSVTDIGQAVPFDINVNLTTGRTVVFSVGRIGGGDQNTGLSLSITETGPSSVPEPTGLLLLSTGLLGLMSSRRRKRA